MAKFSKKRKLIHLFLAEDTTEIDIKKYLDQQVDDENNIDNWIYLINDSFYELDDNIKEMFLNIIDHYLEEDKIQEVLITEKAEYFDSKYIKELKKHGIRNIEIKVYSFNSYILSQINENSVKELATAVKRLNRRRIKTFLEMQIGLPESNELDEMQTAKMIAKLKPYLVKIKPALIYKNTIIEEKYKREEYKPLSIDEAVQLSKKLLIFFKSKKIEEVQIGFEEYNQLETNIFKEKKGDYIRISQTPDFIGGPYDENFNFFVFSSIYYDKVLDIIKKYNIKVKKIAINVNPQIAKFVAGYSNINLENLKNVYDIEAEIKQSLKMPVDEIKIDILESYTDFLDG